MKINKERRRFLKKTLSSGVGVLAYSTLWNYINQPEFRSVFGSDISPVNKSSVIIARDDNFFTDNGSRRDVTISNALHKAIMQLTQTVSREKAWQSLFKPSDIVGIKLNCLSGKIMSPSVAVVDAIIQGLKLAGVKDKSIIIFERSNRELEVAGFRVRRLVDGIQCYGTDELAHGGYETEPQIVGSVGTCFSMIVSRMCTAIINVPVLKDHDLAGISVAMKNFFGVIHNPNKYHGSNCNPFIAELNTHPFIADKLRLTVCDALLAQFNGGPGFKPQWTWNFNGIIVSKDPVAMDRICCNIIEEKRKEMRLPALKQANREPKYISTAASLGLGIDDISKINLIYI